MTMQRRNFLGMLLMGGAALAWADPRAFAAFQVTKSDAEWKKMLSPAAYDVLRHQGTEMPYSSPLDMNYQQGHLFLRRLRPAAISRPTPNTTAAPAGPASGSRCPAPCSPRPTPAR